MNSKTKWGLKDDTSKELYLKPQLGEYPISSKFHTLLQDKIIGGPFIFLDVSWYKSFDRILQFKLVLPTELMK